jgi:hypothetical protein
VDVDYVLLLFVTWVIANAIWIVFLALFFQATVVTFIAHRKGFTGRFRWFLYGLFLFPLAFVHVLTARENQQEIEKRLLREGNRTGVIRYRRCRRCDELVRFLANTCRYCGEKSLSNEAGEGLADRKEEHHRNQAGEKQGAHANAGKNIEVYILGNRAVRLDGSNSGTSTGQEIHYSWTLKTPRFSRATLYSSDTATPNFIPDIQGIYEATLTLTIQRGEGSASTSYRDRDTVTITAWD